MTIELIQIEQLLFKPCGLSIINLIEDKECTEYDGFNCTTTTASIKYRKAKVTPKKNGQFVALWKRNKIGITEPFTINDTFDFYLIVAKTNVELGCFIFPKKILAVQHILSTAEKKGKRGFRIYPAWDIPSSKQAENTKLWQNKYFINLNFINSESLEKAKGILNIS